MCNSDIAEQDTFADFLASFKKTLNNVFYEKNNLEQFIQHRRFPPQVINDIMSTNPFSVAIPIEFGGRGVKVKECLGILDAAAYESLPLSLLFGINIGLFLEPVGKYGQESVKGNIFNRFLNQQNMGGLMITEPDSGSDALNMQTSNVKKGSNYHIQGIKHWQGLTGMADYWLMTSRAKDATGKLSRDIDFFICDVQQPDQYIHVEEYYNNIGLYPIPYGKNIINIHVPEQFKLKSESSGLHLMMDLLHRSRYQIPGMGVGFIRRMLEEAIKQTTSRFVGGKSLMSLDQVKHQISRIQSAFTISSAMCSRSASVSGIENNLVEASVEANTMKAYITDLMQEAAQILTQLCGANGYKAEKVGSRGIMDSRPFQIFEGSNEMLYTQISEVVLKIMGRQKITYLSEFFAKYELTHNVADYFKSLLEFTVDAKAPQRKIVDLGKIISRVVTANHVSNLGAIGFRADLINNSLQNIKHEISMLVSSYKFQSNISPIEEYIDNSYWMDFS